MTRLTDAELQALIDGCEGAPQGKRYLGAQNDMLYLFTGRAPSPDNDHPMHNAKRTLLAKVYDDAEGKRLAQLDPATIRSLATEVMESREAMKGVSGLDPNSESLGTRLNKAARTIRAQETRIAELEAALAKAAETADAEFTAKLRYRDERMAADAEVKRLREALDYYAARAALRREG
jgi:hypothetical protein